MNTLTSKNTDSSESTAAVAPTTYSLLVRQPGQPERLVSLAAGKYTVGSSSRCQIQLENPQVRPLHCLITQESNGVFVTRWAAGALLNDQEFTSSSFELNDKLCIGDVELTLVGECVVDTQSSETATDVSPVEQEVTEEKSVVEETATIQPPSPPAKPASSQRSSVAARRVKRPSLSSAMSAANSLESDRLVRQLWSANYGARQRCRSLVSTLREVRAEASHVDQQMNMIQEQLRKTLVEREHISEELNRFRSESNVREEQVTEEMDRLIAELNEAYEKSSEAETASAMHLQKWNELRDQLETLQSEREELDKSREAGETLCNSLVETLEAREKSISDLERGIAEAQEAFRQSEENTNQQKEQKANLEAELHQVQEEHKKLTAENEESHEQQEELKRLLDERNLQLEQFRNQLEQVQATNESVASHNEEVIATNDLLNSQIEDLQLQEE